MDELDQSQLQIMSNAINCQPGDFDALLKVTLMVISHTAPRVFMVHNNHVQTVKDIFNLLNEMEIHVTEEEKLIHRAIKAIENKNDYEKQLVETEIATVFSGDVKYMNIFTELCQSDRIPKNEVSRVALKLIQLLPPTKLQLCQDNIFRLLFFAEQAFEMIQEEDQEKKRRERNACNFERQFLDDTFLQTYVQSEYREPLKALFQFKLKEKINTGKVLTRILNPNLTSPFTTDMDEASVVNIAMVYLVNNCVQFTRARLVISQSEVNNLNNTGALTTRIFDRFTEPVLLSARTSKRNSMEAMDDTISYNTNM